MTSTLILPRNYQIGVCFTYQLCMYCGVNLTLVNCDCDKTIKPSKNNRTVKVSYFRNLAYKPEKIYIKMKSFIVQSNQKYVYKLNIELSHQFTLCSACNSQ